MFVKFLDLKHLFVGLENFGFFNTWSTFRYSVIRSSVKFDGNKPVSVCVAKKIENKSKGSSFQTILDNNYISCFFWQKTGIMEMREAMQEKVITWH